MIRARIFAILFFLVAYTILKGIELAPNSPWIATAAALSIFIVIIGWQILSHNSRVQLNDSPWFFVLADVLTWVGSLTMGVWATFIVLSLGFDIAYLIADFVGQALHHQLLPASLQLAVTPQRIEIFVVFLALGLGFAGFVVTRLGPRLKRVEVRIDNLPASLHGFTIAQISDLHVGPTIRSRYVNRVVSLTNSAEPDLVALTGDLIDGWSEKLAEHLKPLSELRAKSGRFFVTGNHEYYWDAENLIEQISGLGIQPLLNSNATVKVGDAKLLVAGITDVAGRLLAKKNEPNIHEPNLEAASLSNEPSDAEIRVLLAHRPGIYREAAAKGFHLQLSGHTHGGQFFPFNFFIRIFHKYHRGLYRHGDLSIYVNPGSGYWAPANRLGVMAEVTLITLGPRV